MPLEDYAHWNEEALQVWWHEEGKHIETADDYYNPDDYLGTEEVWLGDEPECETVEDCMKNSCFSLPTKTGIWECDICGRQFPEGHPEK